MYNFLTKKINVISVLAGSQEIGMMIHLQMIIYIKLLYNLLLAPSIMNVSEKTALQKTIKQHTSTMPKLTA